MRYWWVNQNATFQHEVEGGYLWSPKRKTNGHRNPFYEFMREVSPGDLVFSFAGTKIPAYGVAISFAYEAPKPEEFGAAGRNWNRIGWRVDVQYQIVAHDFKPAHWMDELGPLLPAKYAPLRLNGYGSQSIYLTLLPEPFALKLASLISQELLSLAQQELGHESIQREPYKESVLWENHLRREIDRDATLTETEKEALVLARRGQGVFRKNVQALEKSCRITKVSQAEHLRASHCKPWRDATHEERLDGNNGLMLTPSIDHLFDRGFISFRDDGKLLISPVAHRGALQRMGVPVDQRLQTPAFRREQHSFLEYHRDAVFLCSQNTRSA